MDTKWKIVCMCVCMREKILNGKIIDQEIFTRGCWWCCCCKKQNHIKQQLITFYFLICSKWFLPTFISFASFMKMNIWKRSTAWRNQWKKILRMTASNKKWQSLLFTKIKRFLYSLVLWLLFFFIIIIIEGGFFLSLFFLHQSQVLFKQTNKRTKKESKKKNREKNPSCECFCHLLCEGVSAFFF